MDNQQTFRALNQEDLEWLAAQRAPTEKLLEGNTDVLAKYRTSAGKLGVIRAVLDGKVFRKP